MHPHEHTPQPDHSAQTARNPRPAPARGAAPAPGLSEHSLLALQRSAGNAAVVQMLRQAGHPWAQDQHQHGAGCGHQQPVQRSAVHDVLRDGGQPLDSATRTDMESRLGADFSDVRIHNDSAAKASAAEVGARAYTSGTHVVIGNGGSDKHTLAHELTHVIQQRQGPVAGTDDGTGLQVSDPSDRFERAAEANATRVMSGPAPSAEHAHGVEGSRLQRAVAGPVVAAPGMDTAVVQRTAEQDLVDDPKAFLGGTALSLDGALGMKTRAPELEMDHLHFVNLLKNWNQHWFLLIPDPRRDRQGRGAYLLTPAVEKYAEAYGGTPEFPAGLAGNPRLPGRLSDESYLHSSYVPYFRGGTTDPDNSVGHKDIDVNPPEGVHGANFVFTAVMNGCAFALTGGVEDGKFTAWHYQSPSSNNAQAKDFRRDRQLLDWFGPEEYESRDQPGLYEATNVLWKGSKGWEVLSQELSVDSADMDKAEIAKFRSRPLNLAPGNEAARTAGLIRIYEELAESHFKKIKRSYEGVIKMQPPPPAPVKQELDKMLMIASTELGAAKLAKNRDDLRGIVQALRQRARDVVTARMGLNQHLKGKEALEDKVNFFFQEFKNAAWLGQLKEELGE